MFLKLTLLCFILHKGFHEKMDKKEIKYYDK
jgi:hypothetical protein